MMDIGSGSGYPESSLSNFAPHPFEIDGVKCNSMEGFLQSLKFENPDMQVFVCQLVGKAAKFKGKKKKWWKRQEGYSNKYQNDYMAALVIHSYSWAFMVMLPIAIVQGFEVGTLFAWILILNASIHLLVDHVKANLMRINLVTDQFIHFIQIVLTFIVWNLKTL